MTYSERLDAQLNKGMSWQLARPENLIDHAEHMTIGVARRPFGSPATAPEYGVLYMPESAKPITTSLGRLAIVRHAVGEHADPNHWLGTSDALDWHVVSQTMQDGGDGKLRAAVPLLGKTSFGFAQHEGSRWRVLPTELEMTPPGAQGVPMIARYDLEQLLDDPDLFIVH